MHTCNEKRQTQYINIQKLITIKLNLKHQQWTTFQFTFFNMTELDE